MSNWNPPFYHPAKRGVNGIAARVKCLLSPAAKVAPAIFSPSVRMPHTLPASLLLSRCALALACAFALGGCSILQGESGEAVSLPPAAGAPVEPGISKAKPDSPTWNLETLESTTLHRRPDVLTLERAWILAVANDPDYQAALSGRAAAQTEIRLGRAAILPQVQAGYSRSKITGLQRNFAGGGVREGDLDYDATSAYIQLQQPVFNLDRYAQYQRGYARAQLGEAEFAMREHEAAMRLATAFLDAVEAQGRSELTQALADSLEEQVHTQEALFERNEASRVDAQETRARLALARADAIAAQDELRVARRRLQALIGQEPPALASLDSLQPQELYLKESLIQWLERARLNGAAIRRGEAQVRVADTEVRRATARHLPTADLVIALADADSENLDSLSQRSNTFQVGVQMHIPIFSGGYDTANHARSRHERQQAEHELAQAHEVTAAEVTRQYSAVQSNAERIEALMSSVRSAEESLHAARKGYEYGVNSNLDVLRRQDSLFQARHELLAARALWLEARVALSAAAGEPILPVFMSMDTAILN